MGITNNNRQELHKPVEPVQIGINFAIYLAANELFCGATPFHLFPFLRTAS